MRQPLAGLAMLLGLGAAWGVPPNGRRSCHQSRCSSARHSRPPTPPRSSRRARGSVAAWFGGSGEGRPDVVDLGGALRGRPLAVAAQVADGRQATGERYPCWNPVLFQPSSGPLLLFYRAGPSPRGWWTLLRTSSDQGRSWSQAVRLPQGIPGPDPREAGGAAGRDAPRGIEHRGRRLGGPHGARETGRSRRGWRVVEDRAAQRPERFRGDPADDPGPLGRADPDPLPQPPAGRDRGLVAGRRTLVGCDDGHVAAEPERRDRRRPPRRRRFLLAYNPTASGRSPLALAVSRDGRSWQRAVTLEDDDGEYSYPALIQGRDGRVHVTYTWRRQRIQHVVLDPGRIN